MRILACFVCFLCTIVSATDRRRFIKQLDTFKREVRDELSFISSDINLLFESVGGINETLQDKTKVFGPQMIVNEQVNMKKGKSCLNDSAQNQAFIEEFAKKCNMLEKAFASEKQLNRDLKKRLQAIEDGISGIYKDVVRNVTSFMNDVNETIGERLEAAVNHKESMAYDDYGEKEMEATTTESTLKSCDSVLRSGVYDVNIDPTISQKSVYCDADTDGGGWIVIMRRQDGSVDFNRPWDHYKNGFGNMGGEFWLGNDVVYKLTKSKPLELRIDLRDFDGLESFAQYDKFEVGPEAEKYKLKLEGYSGTAGDALTDTSVEEYTHNGMKFSTPDSDNDKSWRSNCASVYPGGWWFNHCFGAHLTAKYSYTSKIRRYHGIIWEPWTGWDKAAKFVEMKIR